MGVDRPCRCAALKIVFRNNALKLGAYRVVTSPLYSDANNVQLRLQLRPTQRRAGSALDPVARCRSYILVLVEKILMHFLSGSQSRHYNLGIPFRLTRQTNHGPRKIDNADRFAHVEHWDVSVLSDRRGLQDQRHRFADSHEVALDLSMSYG